MSFPTNQLVTVTVFGRSYTVSRVPDWVQLGLRQRGYRYGATAASAPTTANFDTDSPGTPDCERHYARDVCSRFGVLT